MKHFKKIIAFIVFILPFALALKATDTESLAQYSAYMAGCIASGFILLKSQNRIA